MRRLNIPDVRRCCSGSQVGRVAPAVFWRTQSMKITKSQLKQIIKEELEKKVLESKYWTFTDFENMVLDAVRGRVTVDQIVAKLAKKGKKTSVRSVKAAIKRIGKHIIDKTEFDGITYYYRSDTQVPSFKY